MVWYAYLRKSSNIARHPLHEVPPPHTHRRRRGALLHPSTPTATPPAPATRLRPPPRVARPASNCDGGGGGGGGGVCQVAVVAGVSASATYLSVFLRMDTTDLLAALYSDCKSVPRVHMCRISLSVHNLFYL